VRGGGGGGGATALSEKMQPKLVTKTAVLLTPVGGLAEWGGGGPASLLIHLTALPQPRASPPPSCTTALCTTDLALRRGGGLQTSCNETLQGCG
jgi:hypothetical protein